MTIHTWNLFNCKIIVFGIYYLPKLRLKTRANLSRHCPTADCYFQIYVWQAIASFGAHDSRSTVKGTKIPAVFQQPIFNRKAAVNWTCVWPAVLQLSRVIRQTFISRPTRLISITTFLPRVDYCVPITSENVKVQRNYKKNPHAPLCSSSSHVGNQVKQPHTRQRKQHSVVQMTISLKIIKWLQNDLAPDRVKEPASQLNKNRIEDKCVQFRGSCTNIRIQKVKECYFQWTIRTRQKESYMNESNDCSQLKRVIETTEYLNKKPRFLPGGGGYFLI